MPSLIYLFSLFIDVAAPGLTCSTQGGLSLGFSVAAGKLVFFFFLKIICFNFQHFYHVMKLSEESIGAVLTTVD